MSNEKHSYLSKSGLDAKRDHILSSLDANQMQDLLSSLGLEQLKQDKNKQSFKFCSPFRASDSPSCTISLIQSKRGIREWIGVDAVTNQGFDLLGLVAHQRGLNPSRDFRQVLSEVASFAGIPMTAVQNDGQLTQSPHFVAQHYFSACFAKDGSSKFLAKSGVVRHELHEGMGLDHAALKKHKVFAGFCPAGATDELANFMLGFRGQDASKPRAPLTKRDLADCGLFVPVVKGAKPDSIGTGNGEWKCIAEGRFTFPHFTVDERGAVRGMPSGHHFLKGRNCGAGPEWTSSVRGAPSIENVGAFCTYQSAGGKPTQTVVARNPLIACRELVRNPDARVIAVCNNAIEIHGDFAKAVAKFNKTPVRVEGTMFMHDTHSLAWKRHIGVGAPAVTQAPTAGAV